MLKILQNKITKAGEYVYTLDKIGKEVEVSGVFEVKKGERVVVVTDLVFLKPKTKGKVHVKGVVHGGGYLEFRGKIKIGKKAIGADGYLKQEILLLDPGAQAVAIPDLEIEQNEVKASHAAAVSTFDSEQMFYLMSRGFSKVEARDMIVAAWLK